MISYINYPARNFHRVGLFCKRLLAEMLCHGAGKSILANIAKVFVKLFSKSLRGMGQSPIKAAMCGFK